MLHEVHTEKEIKVSDFSQKQYSCVHNPRFGIVRKHCVTKQKKDCEHNILILSTPNETEI